MGLKSWIETVSTKPGLMCLAQGHNTVTPVRLEPATSRSQDKHSATEPLLSLILSAFYWFTQDKYLHMTA